ncbi:tRNA lysidine(34) synthetase TilS [Algoriphagus sp. AK58]|uniref:tRNA lysidine(34) synthetase TilS n=1 Tax=Algoriphagus sp. AK58 TaxID=1406877 RepID=UPI00164F5FC7|nr:tRNA lysidine(34) synthetase TilS [Algoriphagus sp. AK58]MBC6367074.1 tRNA lysidine(34) synthetase TilS [Algoriphagus sp. AK58]
MQEAFIAHIRKRQLLDPNKVYLLACSGGLDSMALANLLSAAKISFEIAHVNFNLRGEDSDADQQFVQSWAEERAIKFHLKTAETIVYAQRLGISTQMAAREIRYQFFEEIRSKYGLDGILLAHHEDDQIETIFLNLLRGTGIEGIYGMSERKGWLIRPLLTFSREEIADYMQTNSHEWREDLSNQKSDYKRNNLRINGLPHIFKLETDARKNLLTSFNRLKDTGKAFSGLFDFWKAEKIREEEGIQYLAYSDISHLPGGASLLYFWLRPYGFNSEQALTIWESLSEIQSGSVFHGNGYQLWFDRKEMMLCPKPSPFQGYILQEHENELILPEGSYEIRRSFEKSNIDPNPQNAVLDLSQLEFPLEIRTWKDGDRFIPLGMNTEKKISDFLIDLKVPLAKKQDVKVLVSGGKIAWVIGIRIADWAKLTPATRHTLHFKKR